jgi:hypothetical protein
MQPRSTQASLTPPPDFFGACTIRVHSSVLRLPDILSSSRSPAVIARAPRNTLRTAGRPAQQGAGHRSGATFRMWGTVENLRLLVVFIARKAAGRKPTAIGLGDYGQVAAGRLPIGRRLPSRPTSLQQSACGGIESSRRAKSFFRNCARKKGPLRGSRIPVAQKAGGGGAPT